MTTHNIGFYEDLTKISLNYHQISSKTHLISSAGRILRWHNINVIYLLDLVSTQTIRSPNGVVVKPLAT